ncbi:MAG: glycosyltransferase [Bacilli bacterium]|jgi:glycosyltransferase involved in cell wall biosynthesis|nr:glycosyltransferase [Bacilli bacterium]
MIENKNTRVSVAMVTYNSEKFLKPQLDTIIDNLSSDDEIIISDDGSKDTTIQIINEYASRDARIKLFHNEGKHGVDGNYENALRNVQGEYIFLSDDDNVWVANKVEKVLSQFFLNDKIVMVMHDCIVTDEKLNIIRNSFFQDRNAKPGIVRNIIKTAYGGSLIAIKNTILNRVFPFPKKMPYFYDEWIGMVCTKHGKVLFLNEPLSYWRRHGGSQSTQFLPKPHKGKLKRFWIRLSTRIKKFWFAIRY